jgi:hypothetical protein
MTGDTIPRTRPALWRLVPLVLVFVYVLTDVLLSGQQIEGAGDDFWPQWTLVHLAATGHGADSYDYQTQARLLRDLNLPPHRYDVLRMPQIENIGICPYPPTFVLLYAPICWQSFYEAHLTLYYISVGLGLIAATAINSATGDRLTGLPAAIALPTYMGVQSAILIRPGSWPTTILASLVLATAAGLVFGRLGGRPASWFVAATAILCFPGAGTTLHLGQNTLLTLVLLALGWLDLVRRRDLTAGLWWGLLSYKIHWLVAVGWLPLVIGRPRVLLGMAASAGAFTLAATAFLGPEAWVRWFGQASALDRIAATDPFFRENLLIMGCDLRSVLYRYIEVPAISRLAGWAALAGVAAVTAVWYRRRPAADPAGREGAGLLFASGLTAAHLYYYDETVFLLPLLILWSYRPAVRWWQLIALVVLTAAYYCAARYVVVWSLAFEGPPVQTFCVLALWLLSLTVKAEELRA